MDAIFLDAAEAESTASRTLEYTARRLVWVWAKAHQCSTQACLLHIGSVKGHKKRAESCL